MGIHFYWPKIILYNRRDALRDVPPLNRSGNSNDCNVLWCPIDSLYAVWHLLACCMPLPVVHYIYLGEKLIDNYFVGFAVVWGLLCWVDKSYSLISLCRAQKLMDHVGPTTTILHTLVLNIYASLLRHSRHMDRSLTRGTAKGAQTQLTGNKITNMSNAHPHYKRDYIVPKYGGPIVIYSAWKVYPNISPEHSKLKRIPKPSQDKHNNCLVGQVIAESSTTPQCTTFIVSNLRHH